MTLGDPRGRFSFTIAALAIHLSASKQISKLMVDLSSDRAATRDGAIARLTVIGQRAGGPLAALIANRDAPATARSAALRVFEAIDDPRGLDAALSAIDDPVDDVAQAAIAALRPHLRGPRGATAVDSLARAALDRTRALDLREAAVRQLLGLEKAAVRPLLKALRSDPATRIAALAAPDAQAQAASEQGRFDKLVAQAADGHLTRDADLLRQAIMEAGCRASLPALHRVVERIREREQTAAAMERRTWTAVRAAAHVVLARRGSRVALYDLRESIEKAREPLPVAFLAALDAIGDVSCLEAIVTAYVVASKRSDQDWWRDHLVQAFRTIARRERLTRRNSIVKRLSTRWPEALDELYQGGQGRQAGPGRQGGHGRRAESSDE